MKALTKNMIVISFDCLSAFDYSLIETLPNFQRVFKNGSFSRNVETIYPSLTYPCHSTIVTGKYPKNHGVINNTLIQPGAVSPDWNWYRSAIKGTTLYDEAYKSNLTTAALLWPVTGKAKSIQYNLPEIFANRPWQNQIMVSLLNGTASYQWELNKLYGNVRNGLSQPELDDFVLESTVHTILTKKPNLLLVHFTDLDTMRHDYGVRSKEARDAIHRHDKRLGRILDALEDSGKYSETTIVILGDHAALDENKAVNLNVHFHDQNLLTLNSKGKIIDWKAYCKGCDGSAYIYLKDPEDIATKDKLKRILENLMAEPNNGIEKIITGEEAGKLGADPNCAFMIEAANGYYFIEDHLGEFIKEVTEENRSSNPKFLRACHGYSPDKEDYQTFFLASGKGVQPNEEIPSMGLIDIGPTLARLLGLDLGETDGQVIEQFILSV
ncbi:alkaline phosphatase family protein [Robertmurraya yapensis]|uniref:Alkaline phosphatase family protein n=1 Tax=Bacillus yapensis TaxID=2492960 RepID=A0A3S0KBV3_9BACI|nr:ectonucleotide pyrophosphatase/phosphodiesterase [Bacillus yapensis]RTR27122.1 alkaline phosphatase family protein [Bacillus yapensis]TKS93969.1 alkaline phosphatase family protein [Bacillus yapensis]